MRREEYAGLLDNYYFELSRGTVLLTVDHRSSPMGGHTIRLGLFDDRSRLIPSRPSEVGVAGFDGLWTDDPFPEIQTMCANAYGVPDAAVTRLVDALKRLEGV